MHKIYARLAEAGEAIGKGLIAGAAGTLAMSISQLIEMKITNRSGSSTPVIVAGKALGVEPKGKGKLEAKEENQPDNDAEERRLATKVQQNANRFSQLMHYAYGTSQGIPRGILDLAGLKGWQAAATHFALVWGTEQIMLPSAGASKPITKWNPAMIASDVVHHTVYVSVAGWLYDRMRNSRKKVCPTEHTFFKFLTRSN